MRRWMLKNHLFGALALVLLLGTWVRPVSGVLYGQVLRAQTVADGSSVELMDASEMDRSLAWAGSRSAFGVAVPSSAATARAHRALQAPVLDGSADDPVWRTAPVFGGFRQFAPQVGADPSFQTEFQVAYDERNLYVLVRAYDASPDSIMRALSRRDVRGPSDQISVLVDAYADRRSGFEFHVNPDGVKRDFAIFNDGDRDGSWNGVWDVATGVDSLGWMAEFRIPFSQLRYADVPEHTFGFGVRRDIERLNQSVAWPEYDPSRSGLSSQLGRLEGLAGIRSGRPLELTPYTVTSNVPRAMDSGGFRRLQEISAGGDLKLGLTPGITLDATVNPDFGQVEADPAVLNLTAFETFLAERRPFFVEGMGLYRFALNCYAVADCGTNEGLFYSRRVGRAPTLLATYGDAATPVSTPIAAAAKLTGRTRQGLSFGVLDAATRRLAGAEGRTVEPATNYAVVRAQQDLRGGEAGIGWVGTAVNRSLDAWTEPVLHREAYASGVSFRNRFHDGNYELFGMAAGSRVAGSADAILRTQRGPVHYFQQPDAGLELDVARTHLSGYAAQLRFGKYGGGITRFETSFVRHSPGFEVNDLGYMRRADIQDWSTWTALNFRSQRWIYRWASFNANHWRQWNTAGTRLDNAVNLNGHMGLRNNWDVHAGGTLSRLGANYCDRCTRGGPLLRQSIGFFPWFGFNADNRRKLVPSLWVNLGYTDEGRSRNWSLSPSLSLRPSARMAASIGLGITRDRNSTQWFGNYTDAGGTTHYSFAHLDQRTLSMNTRLNYTITPDLTLELYGQPFVSRGTYSDVRELSETPGAAAYADRFRAYDSPAAGAAAFTYSQLRTNMVLRWEFRPGSALFLVWAHGREAWLEQNSGQPWHRNYRDVLELHPENTFLIKASYWFSR